MLSRRSFQLSLTFSYAKARIYFKLQKLAVGGVFRLIYEKSNTKAALHYDCIRKNTFLSLHCVSLTVEIEMRVTK